MMINRLHARFHRPEKGWDPVPTAHAFQYAEKEWSGGVREHLLDELEGWVGGLAGKRVLDLGGGPGQYAVAFARRGAQVTWYDVSMTYRAFAENKARENQVEIDFLLGYMDEAPERLGAEFDLVFNRICCYYGRSDRSFARVLFSLVRPGGVVYIDTNHSGWRRESLSHSARFRTWLNDALAIKIGHPFPPHGRIAGLFSRFQLERMLIDYSAPTNDRLFFKRAQEA